MEFASISNDGEHLKKFCKSYESAIENGVKPEEHAIEYISGQGFIGQLDSKPELRRGMVLMLIVLLKFYREDVSQHLEQMHKGIKRALNDLFPPSQQLIIEGHRISESIGCDILVPLNTLISWSRQHCVESASDPGCYETDEFRLFYWAREPVYQAGTVDPLPNIFLSPIIDKVFELVEDGKAFAFCHKCQSYCNSPDLEVQNVGFEGALRIFDVTLTCTCGHLFWSRETKLHLNLGAKV